jgi:hypothetical protein
MKTVEKIKSLFNSFEAWTLVFLSNVLLDTSLTMIGTHKYGILAEQNPIIFNALQNGMMWFPFIQLVFFVFVFGIYKFVFTRSFRFDWVAKGVGWVTLFSWFFIGPMSWISLEWLGWFR